MKTTTNRIVGFVWCGGFSSCSLGPALTGDGGSPLVTLSHFFTIAGGSRAISGLPLVFSPAILNQFSGYWILYLPLHPPDIGGDVTDWPLADGISFNVIIVHLLFFECHSRSLAHPRSVNSDRSPTNFARSSVLRVLISGWLLESIFDPGKSSYVLRLVSTDLP